jgi:hypothetical protein
MLKSKPFLVGERAEELPDVFVGSGEGVSNVPVQGDRVFDTLGGVQWLQNREHTMKVDNKTLYHCDFCARGSVKLYACQVRISDGVNIVRCLKLCFSRVATPGTVRQNARSATGKTTVSVCHKLCSSVRLLTLSENICRYLLFRWGLIIRPLTGRFSMFDRFRKECEERKKTLVATNPRRLRLTLICKDWQGQCRRASL